MNDVSYIDDFVFYLKETKGSSVHTIQAYERDLLRFYKYIDSNHFNLTELSQKDICVFKDKMLQSGLAPSSVSRALSSVRSFYQFLISKDHCTDNPAKGIKNEKPEKKFFEVISGKEVELLLAQPNLRDIKGLRDKAMLEMLYATGMKVSELISLNVEDLNLQLEFVKCHGENRAKKERVVLLYPIAVKSISNYLLNARKLMVSDKNESALFVNVNGERMTRQGFWKILKQYAKQAKIKSTITPHTLRHSFATHLLENGADIKDIKEILGHADISSTQVYAQFLKSRIKNSYLKHHPRS